MGKRDVRFTQVGYDPRFRLRKKKKRKLNEGEEEDERFKTLQEENNRGLVDKYGRKVDLLDAARGEATLESSSDEYDTDIEDQIDSEEDDEEEVYGYDMAAGKIKYGHSTRRIAICNMDFESISSVDLLAALRSVVPVSSRVHKVAKYLSDFGKERLDHEQRFGPQELLNLSEEEEVEELENIGSKKGKDAAKEKERRQDERIRRYEAAKLRYYYCIAECDTVQTAESIYDTLDGNEIELTMNRLDLRFVPDDVEFEKERLKDEADEVPDSYEPSFAWMGSKALNTLSHSKPKLRWDEDDPKRAHLLRRKFTADDLHNDDLKAYIASSEDESDDENAANRAAAFKGLLRSAGAENDSEHVAAEDPGAAHSDMISTFDTNLEKQLQDKIKRRARSGDEEKSVWEEYLEKRKQRKKDKKKAAKGMGAEGDEDLGFADPFFAQDDDKPKKESKRDSLKKKKKGKRDEYAEPVDPALQLLADEEASDGAEFEPDYEDSRFAALKTSSKFAMDPTAPDFRKVQHRDKATKPVRDTGRKVDGGREDRTAIPVEPVSKVGAVQKSPNAAAGLSNISDLIGRIKAKSQGARKVK
eukprot:Clim_evm18s159 gene=Clim_evmTU18s159